MPSNMFDDIESQAASQGATPANTPASKGNMFDQIEDQSNQKINTPSNPITGQPKAEVGNSNGGSTFWDNIDILNRNFANVANGGLQLGAQALQAVGIDTSGFQKQLANQQAKSDQEYKTALESSPVTGKVTDVLSKVGAAVATPGTQPILGAKAIGAGAKLLQAGAASALAGGEEYAPGATTQESLDNRAKTAGTAGAFGLAGQSLGNMAGQAIQDAAPYVGKLAGKLFTTPVQEAADSVDKGLLTTVGGATGNDVIQGVESTLGKIPLVGAKGPMQRGAKAINDEVHSTLDDLGVGAKTTPDLSADLGKSITDSRDAAKAAANADYSKAMSHDVDIPLPTAQQTAQDVLDQSAKAVQGGLSSADISGTGPGKLLKDIADLKDGSIHSSLFDSLRRDLKGQITSISKSGNDANLLPALQSVKKAMDSDLDSSASSIGGGFGQDLKKARQTYADQVAPFKDTPFLGKAADGKIDIDTLVNKAVKNDSPYFTKSIMNNLSPEGQKTFSTAIIQKAADGASKNGSLDLQSFNQQLDKLGDTLTALPKQTQDKINGLKILMNRGDYLLKTAKAAPDNLTSIAAMGTAAGTLIGTHLAAALSLAKTGGASKFVSIALTSPKVTRALIKLAGGKLATKGKDGLIKSTLNHIITRMSRGHLSSSDVTSTMRQGLLPAAAVQGANNVNNQ